MKISEKFIFMAPGYKEALFKLSVKVLRPEPKSNVRKWNISYSW